MLRASLDLKLDAEVCFDFVGRDHLDGVPWAAIEEGAVGALARALLAPDAKLGVDFDAAEGRVVLVLDPVHAIFDGAVGHAGGRPGAARATLGDDGQLPGLLLARCFDALGLRFALDDFPYRYVELWHAIAPLRMKRSHSPK